MKDMAFVITAYKQKNLVEENILRIQNEYKTLNEAKIIIVTTSEVDVGFKALEQKYKNVIVIEYPDAPGS